MGRARAETRVDRAMLIEYGRKRTKKGAGPVTLGLRLGVIKMIITHAAAVHRLDISSDPVDFARIALKRLGLIGKARIVKFAVATTMRLDEIYRVGWRDLDVERRMLLVRGRKQFSGFGFAASGIN